MFRVRSIARRARLPPKTWPRSGYRIDQLGCAQFPCAPEPNLRQSSVALVVVNIVGWIIFKKVAGRISFPDPLPASILPTTHSRVSTRLEIEQNFPHRIVSHAPHGDLPSAPESAVDDATSGRHPSLCAANAAKKEFVCPFCLNFSRIVTRREYLSIGQMVIYFVRKCCASIMCYSTFLTHTCGVVFWFPLLGRFSVMRGSPRRVRYEGWPPPALASFVGRQRPSSDGR